MHSSVKSYLIIALLSLTAALLVSETAEAIYPPVIDFSGNWSYKHSGSPSVKLRLTISDMLVKQSTISMDPLEYYTVDTPGKEEIIDADVNIDVLMRDASDNWLFSDGGFSITEDVNTYLSATLTNVCFEPDLYNSDIIWLNANFDLDNLINLDTSANARPSRFIELLSEQIIRYGEDWTNLRMEMFVLTGVGDFTKDSTGTLNAKIEGIPEPASAALLGLGLAALAGLLKKKKSV